jgi:ABC-type glycerol-3-phosphate transport system substrate-binding protein
VACEREKLDAILEWNHELGAQNGGATLQRAAVPSDTSLADQDLEAFRIRGLAVAKVDDLDAAARFVRPPRRWRIPAFALGVAITVLAASLVAFRPWSPGCPSKTTVSIVAMWSGEEQHRFDDVLEHFCRETGIHVQYNNVSDGEMPEYLELRADDPPDVAMVPQPGLIRELVAKGRLTHLGPDAARKVTENYPPLAQEVMRVGDQLYGVWFKASNKSLWWYDPKMLRSRGIEPQSAWSWEQTLDAARRTKAAGVPWLAVGAADGWPLTDLFENIYLRLAGPQCYDALSRHAIDWTDGTVVDALTRMRELFDEGGVVNEARPANFRSSVAQVFGGQAKAATLPGADFVLSVIQADTSARAEADFDYFEFPAVDKSDPSVVAGGDIAVALTDKPEVQKLLTFLATPEAAAIWTRRGGFVSPNQKLDPRNYRDPMTKRAAQSLTQHLTGTGSFRFDLSDLQPPAFGATPGQGMQLRLQALLGGQEDPRTVALNLELDASFAFRFAPWNELPPRVPGAPCGNP